MLEKIPILYKDDCLVAVRKPAGIHVHPSALSPGEPAMLGLLRDQLGQRLYPVHRLDRATSGVLLLGLDQESCARLSAAFQDRVVTKIYAALVRGWMAELLWEDSPIDDGDGLARDSQTRFNCLERYEIPLPLGAFPSVRASLVSCEPQQGRRHQLRRHAARRNHPIIGDTGYGDRHHNHFYQSNFGLGHLQLFSVGLGFYHPWDGQWLSISDPAVVAAGGLLEQVQPFRCQYFGSIPNGVEPPRQARVGGEVMA